MNCPYCKAADVQRSRRRGLRERVLLRLLLLAPMRCLACQRRFIVFFRGSGRRGSPRRLPESAHRRKKTQVGASVKRIWLPAMVAALMFILTLLFTFFLVND